MVGRSQEAERARMWSDKFFSVVKMGYAAHTVLRSLQSRASSAFVHREASSRGRTTPFVTSARMYSTTKLGVDYITPRLVLCSQTTAGATDLLRRACSAQRYLFARSSLAHEEKPRPCARGQGFEEHAHRTAFAGRET